jgi:hypothetical protein
MPHPVQLQLLMWRQSNNDISSLLAISERTVKFPVSNILSKLQVSDRRALSPDKLALKTFASETSSLDVPVMSNIHRRTC